VNKKIIVIVPSAGLGKRFSATIKKTFATLDGIPLLVHTLRAVCDEKAVNEVLPVLAEEDVELGHRLVKEYSLSKIKKIARGGKERQDSIYNALRLLDDDKTNSDAVVLIHDGVRPFIPEGLFEELITELDKGYGGVIPGLPVKETLKEVHADSIVASTVNRDSLWAIQTPQAFTLNVLKKAYDAAYAEGFYATDDSALVERVGGRVKIIMGSPYNIKITRLEDLGMIEFILTKRSSLS